MKVHDLSGRRFGRLVVETLSENQVILPPRQSTEFYRQNQRKAAATKAAKSAITAFGQTKTLAEWATGIGMNRKHIWQRLKRGWPPDKAVSVPCGGSYAAL